MTNPFELLPLEYAHAFALTYLFLNADSSPELMKAGLDLLGVLTGFSPKDMKLDKVERPNMGHLRLSVSFYYEETIHYAHFFIPRLDHMSDPRRTLNFLAKELGLGKKNSLHFGVMWNPDARAAWEGFDDEPMDRCVKCIDIHGERIKPILGMEPSKDPILSNYFAFLAEVNSAMNSVPSPENWLNAFYYFESYLENCLRPLLYKCFGQGVRVDYKREREGDECEGIKILIDTEITIEDEAKNAVEPVYEIYLSVDLLTKRLTYGTLSILSFYGEPPEKMDESIAFRTLYPTIASTLAKGDSPFELSSYEENEWCQTAGTIKDAMLDLGDKWAYGVTFPNFIKELVGFVKRELFEPKI